MKKVFAALGKCLEAFCMFNLAVIVLLFFYSIVMRYVFHSGSAVVDELIKYLFVWFIYLSMALATKEKRHVAVNAFVDLFKGKWRNALSLISNIGWIYFNGFIAFSAILLIKEMMKLGAKTSALGIMQAYLYWILPIGFIWSSIYIIRDVAQIIKNMRAAGKAGEGA